MDPNLIAADSSSKGPIPASAAKATQPREPMHYRVNFPIMVLAFGDNHSAAVSISTGEIFEVIGPAPDDRFIIVKVRGEEFLVFESDLRQRGVRVEAHADPSEVLTQ